MSDRSRSVDRLLPLKPKVLHILLSLADGPRHGYAIMQEVADRTDGHVRVWPAAMYGTLRELEDLDWIAEWRNVQMTMTSGGELCADAPRQAGAAR